MGVEIGERNSAGRPRTALPAARSVLAVVASPGDESCYLGAVLAAFAAQHSTVNVLVLGDAPPDQAAGFRPAAPGGRPHDGLSRFPIEQLAARVTAAIDAYDVDLLITVDGRIAERSAAHAAVQAGRAADVPVLTWTLPHDVAREVRRLSGLAVTGDPYGRIDFELRVRRDAQRGMWRGRRSLPGDVQRARLAVQGDREWLRWLVPGAARTPEGVPT